MKQRVHDSQPRCVLHRLYRLSAPPPVPVRAASPVGIARDRFETFG
ncbi:MAG: hypothetical protein JXB47_09040 [Anaerolineae bacterium]|nr:hypothetical protein [Anaerolineae bacterium]